MSLDDALLTALATYLEAQTTTDPPGIGTIGLVRCGKLQDDPTDLRATLTLHVGDPEDPSIKREIVRDEGKNGNKGGFYGGYQETGGGGVYRYRYTVRMVYFFTATGEDRSEAQSAATDIVAWVERKIRKATAAILALGNTGSEHMMFLMPTDSPIRESGGPPNSFIWRASIHFDAVVLVD